MTPGPHELPAHWSRHVQALDQDGVLRRWHLLDTHAERPVPPGTPTLVCVHGNPTWSYLWRRFLRAAPPGWRVVAVDQLGMGWSERPAEPRTLAMRIDDLDVVTTALGVLGPDAGPVVVLAHDWGGPISLGWALRLLDRRGDGSGGVELRGVELRGVELRGVELRGVELRGVVLGNTAVHQPASSAPPALIRLARARALRTAATVGTPTFVRGATALSRPALPRPVRDNLAAPYREATRRRSIGDFVADIPFEDDHPSRATLDAVAAGLTRLADVPVLLLWGARDPVFTERHLADLLARLPHADVQRYPRASHLVTEDVPESVEHAWSWITAVTGRRPDQGQRRPDEGPPPDRPLWAILDADPAEISTDEREHDRPAVVELGRHGSATSITTGELAGRVRDLAAGLSTVGVRSGDRVGLLVPPGIDLTAVVYACWRAGATIVVADAGLGLRKLGDALRSAAPDHLIAVPAGLAAAQALRVPGRRIVVGALPAPACRLLGVGHSLTEVERRGREADPFSSPAPDPTPQDEAAVLFTSGATGPPKGVVYRFDQLDRQLAQIRSLCRLTSDDRLVAAFAPFALYGPALGVSAAVPAMDVTAPATLTATALAEAVQAIGATVVFASPAALRNVVHTSGALHPAAREALGGVRLMLSAGAPVGEPLLDAVQAVLPNAELHTPYGMTEAMPVADTTRDEIARVGPGNGVLVGHPRPGVEVAIAPLRPDGTADTLNFAPNDSAPDDSALDDSAPDLTGEICVRAGHVKERYDKLWAVEALSSRTPGWHRTGDVGHLDPDGRLWVEGRLAHVITTAAGPRTPVGPEQALERLPVVQAAAVVGVGPVGTQQVVAVVVPGERPGRNRSVLAPPELAAAARACVQATVETNAELELAAVLVTDRLPTDIRHNSKVDRSRVARWAERVLAGGRIGRP